MSKTPTPEVIEMRPRVPTPGPAIDAEDVDIDIEVSSVAGELPAVAGEAAKSAGPNGGDGHGSAAAAEATRPPTPPPDAGGVDLGAEAALARATHRVEDAVASTPRSQVPVEALANVLSSQVVMGRSDDAEPADDDDVVEVEVLESTPAPMAGAPARAESPQQVKTLPPPPPPEATEVRPPTVAPPALPAGAVWPEALTQRPRRKRMKPWFEEVFDEEYLRTLPFMTPEQTLREVSFIHNALQPPEAGQILDIACGYGRHAIELSQRGLRVTGVDLSLPLLIRAADEAQRRELSVDFVHADMRELAFDRQFDGGYCVLSSFGYFDEETNLKVASAIFRSMKPGGRFLIETLNRDYVVGGLPARVWWEGTGCVVLEEVDFNFHTSRIVIRRSVVFQSGRQIEQDISVRAYSLHELGKLMRQAGFRVQEVSGSIATPGRFFGAASRNIIMLCQRPPE